eukprot:CAMPEP_0179377172 /NCGR_PEP_ID=MMETSP0797-20121207/88695_1 /TAXON_ID=47934 /ORGANISM="Dinophysis acuminata, Strain DAEP01" /LENGTH=706 /DNA_ID=CAMNT_0021093229 /DNA_START=81 /DNA_END=2198 /DNA_ORIENTATION=-
MSGGLYAVLGKAQFHASATCPGELLGKTFTIGASDGESYTLDAAAVCASARIKDMILASEGSDTFALPLNKAVLGKVVEFLKYHADTPFVAPKTPLESENLAECGVLKWDVAFINVDKDALFDLMHAAKWLDIPSLMFLTGAKASIMVKDKTADKLRKDFGFTNDLPSGEEEDLVEYWLEFQKKHNIKEDENGLAGAAAIMQGVYAAADKSGVYTETSSIRPKSWRQACWRVTLMQSWKCIAQAPSEIRGDRDIMLDCVEQSSGRALKNATDELRGDKTLVLKAVALDGASLQFAADSLRGAREFVLECLGLDAGALGGASAALQGDRGLVLDAAKAGVSGCLKGAAKSLKSDRGFVLECVAVDPESAKHADRELLADTDFVLQLVKKKGSALEHLPPAMRANKDVVDAAVAAQPGALGGAHTARRSEYDAGLPQDSDAGHAALIKEQCARAGQPKAPAAGPLQGIEGGSGRMMIRVQKSIQFSALSTMTANMGQANYIAANSWLDKIQQYERPEIDAVTLMWGAVGNIGMRWKAFASADFLNANPEALLSIQDASKVLHITTCKMDPPEWYAGSFFDEYSRQGMLTPTAGFGTGGGWTPSEAAAPVQAVARPPAPAKEPEEAEAQESRAPLGGWPALAGAPGKAARAVDLLEAGLEVVEGARVQLQGLKLQNEQLGTVLKKHADGKWKVKLDGKAGNALLRACNI